MSKIEVISAMQEAVYTVLIVSAPMLIAGLLVGIIVSIFQATTQINEQTLSFVPKLVAILIVLLLAFGWMMNTMEDFTVRLMEFVQSIH